MQTQSIDINTLHRKHEFWMSRALKQAEKAYSLGEIPVGCVLVRNGECIAETHNLCESLQDPTAHAEILAIRQVCGKLQTQRLNDCELYVTLEPCPMCAGAIMSAQLRACFYALPDERQGCCASVYALVQDPSFYHRVYCVGNILPEQSARLLQSFFKSKRNQGKTS